MEIQLLLPGENFVLGETGAIALGGLGFERMEETMAEW